MRTLPSVPIHTPSCICPPSVPTHTPAFVLKVVMGHMQMEGMLGNATNVPIRNRGCEYGGRGELGGNQEGSVTTPLLPTSSQGLR